MHTTDEGDVRRLTKRDMDVLNLGAIMYISTLEHSVTEQAHYYWCTVGTGPEY